MYDYVDGTYDVPRINAEFFIEGHRVQGPRVARDGSQLMHESTFAWRTACRLQNILHS